MGQDRISSFLKDLQQGPVALVGGHYEWPGRPSLSAQRSAAEISKLAVEDKSGRLFAYTFLNDIGSACVPGLGCTVSGHRPPALVEVRGLAAWIDSHLPGLEQAALCGSERWEDHARSLGRLLEESGEGSAAVPFLDRLRRFVSRPAALEPWLEDLELLVYSARKDHFRPLLLSLEARHAAPEVIFERSMSNGVSRMLHKIRKRRERLDTGLRVSTLNGDGSSIWTIGAGHEIELRREWREGDTLHAANKCPALLAQLFFYLCRKLSRLSPEARELAVLYLVPCYDRGRLLSGMQAFMELYRDFEHWFGVSKVTLTSAFYTDMARGVLICDGLTRRAGEETIPFLRPLRAEVRPTTRRAQP